VVEGDPTQLESALLNLAVNARDAMPGGGQITFTSRDLRIASADGQIDSFSLPPGHYVELSVSDTGTGIPPDVLPRIFEPFFTTKEIGKGSGLGLAAVYGTVKSHGGNIRAYSEPGQGTVFRLFFPVARVEAAPLPVGTQQLQRGSGRVLVVDDEPSVRATTSRLLRGLGYQVETADSGMVALQLCAEHRFDALVVDLMMPGMTGAQLLQRLREKGQRIPSLLVSGFDLGGSPEAAAARPDGMLQKPFTQADLAQQMARMLSPEAAAKKPETEGPPPG
jgi:CheY-like chemotaxis protein